MITLTANTHTHDTPPPHTHTTTISPSLGPCSLSDLDPKLFAPGVSVVGKSEKELAKQEQVGDRKTAGT